MKKKKGRPAAGRGRTMDVWTAGGTRPAARFGQPTRGWPPRPLRGDGGQPRPYSPVADRVWMGRGGRGTEGHGARGRGRAVARLGADGRERLGGQARDRDRGARWAPQTTGGGGVSWEWPMAARATCATRERRGERRKKCCRGRSGVRERGARIDARGGRGLDAAARRQRIGVERTATVVGDWDRRRETVAGGGAGRRTEEGRAGKGRENL